MALEAVQDFRLSRTIFTPTSLQDHHDVTRGMLSLPSSNGGANWEHSAFDPETGIVYVPSRTQLQVLALAKNPDSDIELSQGFGVRAPRVQGLEIVKPPYGRVTAIDMNSGEHLWWIANADTPERIKNHPLLEGIDVPGQVSRPDLACYSPKHCCLSAKARRSRPALFFAQSTKPRVRYSLNWTCRTIRRVCHSPMSMMASNTWPCSLAAVVIPHSWSLTRFPDSVACGL